jgi:putative transposase
LREHIRYENYELVISIASAYLNVLDQDQSTDTPVNFPVLVIKKSKFSEVQIVKIFKEYDAGKQTNQGFMSRIWYFGTYFLWKQKNGGMDAQQLKELKALQDENARLKRMFADLSLDHRILKDIIEKKL